MSNTEIVEQYKKAYFDLYGKHTKVSLHGSWYAIGESGTQTFSPFRARDLARMTKELQRRKKVAFFYNE